MSGLFSHRELYGKTKVLPERLAFADGEWQYQRMKLRVREIRRRQGLTIEQLAEKAGTVKGYVSEIENGKKFPSGTVLLAIAEALGVAVVELFDDEDLGRDIIAHIEVMKDLSAEDRKAVARHALGLLQRDAG